MNPLYKQQAENVLLLFKQPEAYWYRNLAAPGDLKSLLVPQGLVLAAIPALAMALGLLMRFKGMFIGPVMLGVALQYGIAVGTWFLLAFVVEFFSKKFGAHATTAQARKLALGGMTPIWVAGALQLLAHLPVIAIIGTLAGLGYAGYVMLLGLPIMVGSQHGRTVPYLGAILGTMLMANIILSAAVQIPIRAAVRASLGF